MGTLDAGLRAALRRATVRAHVVLEIEGAPGGTIRLARLGEPVSSRSLGHYQPRASWSRLSRSLSGFRGSLQAPTCNVDVDDTDGRFRATHGVALRDLRATVKLVCVESSAAATTWWATLFVGVVDRVSAVGSKLTLSLRQADDPLARNTYQPPITARAWPNRDLGPQVQVEQLAPVILGRHDALGFAGDKGMLAAQRVDTVGFRYLASADHVSILRVYVDGVLVDPDDYEVAHTYDGAFHAVTLIVFAADQAEKPVTFDAQGVEDAAGATLTAPGAQLLYVLRERAFNARRRGAYLADSAAPVSAAHVEAADAYLAALGHSGSYALGAGGATGQKVLADFLRSFEVDASFTADGKLALAALDHRRQQDRIYFGPGAPDPECAAAYVLDIPDSEQPNEEEDAESVLRAVVAKAGLRRAGTATYAHSRAVQLPGEQAARDTLEMPWAPSNPSTGSRQVTLYPIGTAENSGWTGIAGAATAHEAVDDPEGEPDEGATRIRTVTTSAPCEVAFQMQAHPPAASIRSVKIVWRSRDSSNSTDMDIIRPYVLRGGVRYYGPETEDPSGSYTTREWLMDLDPSTNAAWTEAGFNASRFGLRRNNATDNHDLTQLYVVSDHYPATESAPAVIEAASRRVRRYRIAPRMLKVKARLDALDLELGDLVAVSWARRGWGRQPWERRLHRLHGVEADLRGRALTLTLEDVQDYFSTLWLQGAATVACVPYALGDGVGLVTHGGAVTITRASVKYLDDAAGEGIQEAGPLVKILENVLPCDRRGVRLEGASTNLIPDSSVVRVTAGAPTGWTLTPGAGASIALTTAAEALLFEATEAGQVLEFTAAAPHTGASVATATATAAVAKNAMVSVTIIRWDTNDEGEPLAWRLQRGVDGWWWNAGASAWQAGQVDNLMPFASAWAPHYAVLSAGGTATTLTLSVVQPAGGTAGRTNLLGHVQLESNRWPSSPIITQATAVTRAADVVTIANDHAGVALWPHLRGSWEFEVSPEWSAADCVAGTRFYLCSLEYPEGEGSATKDTWALYYEVGVGVVFGLRVASVWHTCAVQGPAGAPTRGTRFKVRVRYTSALGEWGKAPATVAVRDAAGVATADVIVGSLPVPVADALFYLGSDSAGGSPWNGWIHSVEQSPFCWPDERMRA